MAGLSQRDIAQAALISLGEQRQPQPVYFHGSANR